MPDDGINWTVLDPIEKFRVYHFPTEKIKFEGVCKIEVRPSGKHRLEMEDGTKAFVNTGWNALIIDVEEWTC